MPSSQTAQKNISVFKKLKPYYKHLKKVKWAFTGGVLASILYGASSGLGLPAMAKYVFPIIFNGPENAKDTPQWLLDLIYRFFGENPQQGVLVAALIAMPLAMSFRALGHFISSYLMTYCGLKVSESIRTETFDDIQRKPLAFFQKYKSGDLLARLMGDTEIIKTSVVNVSNDLVKQPATLFFALFYIVNEAIKKDSFFFAFLTALSAPLIIIPIRLIGKRLSKRSRQMAYLNGDLTASITESLQSPLEIRAYNLEDSQVSSFQNKIRSLLRLTLKHARYKLIPTPLIEIVAAICLTAALYLGASKGMTLEYFLALSIALYMAYEPVKKLSKIHGILRSAEAPLERLEKIRSESPAVHQNQPFSPLTEPFQSSIEFSNVSFSYEDGTIALKEINLKIEEGEIVALKGKSGAGKSTFINLIPRFYEASEGSLKISGTDSTQINLNELRDHIGYVPQQPILFNKSVRENILVGKPNATDDEVKQAAKNAFADEFINELSEGYNTILSERGNSLSGGQRQRIAIARAFLKNAPILILDEATSALDSESEEKITTALSKLIKNKTVLMIAHRESSLKSATRHLLFENGKIIADTPHSI